MRIVETFPHAVREEETVWIPLPGGMRLAARLWLPEDAERNPVPAVVEYIPYRRRDFTRARDEPMHRWFAGHGYAALRIDLRGSGDSDGLLADEYPPQEQDDAVAAIAWIAAQPWCSGRVGMIGKSWGGFAALQVAACQPPALAAAIAVCATDDRYGDDAHYMGGCLLNENLGWGGSLFTFNAYPPDPDVVGARWKEMWLERLHHAEPFPALWLQHQRRDAYWAHGSVAEDFDAVRCPVYAVGGWADAYSNAVPRLLAGLKGPRKGLIGPWAHLYPHEGVPGPAIGFLQEALRWWDHWLKGRDTGMLDEPMLRVWMQDWVPPATFHAVRPGRWVAEAAWPSARIAVERLPLDDMPPPASPRTSGGGGRAPRRERPEGGGLQVRSPQSTGQAAGAWCSFGAPGDLPGDQRVDDAGSLVFDTPPLEAPVEILGFPAVTLEVAADRPQAMLAVRLCDVAPDGASLRVTYGLLNLAHRDGSEAPTPLEPGRRYRVQVPLNVTAHAFPAGHRIRVAVSTAYWPIAWPSPEAAAVTVFPGDSALALPVRPPSPEDGALPPFAPAEGAALASIGEVRGARVRRTVERDLATGDVVAVVSRGDGDLAHGSLTRIDAIGLELAGAGRRIHRIRDDNPLSALSDGSQTVRLSRGAWSVTIATSIRQTATPDAFRIEATLAAHEGDALVFKRAWDLTIPRDNM